MKSVVIAGIDLELLKVQIGDVGADLVGVPVVADDHHGGVIVLSALRASVSN